jgi:[protein-PII] uridylyltransferase
MAIKSYKKELAAIREQCFQPETLKNDSFQAIHCFVKKTDQILNEIFNEHLKDYSGSVSLLAIGGYGRSELCPYSDLDCLILYEGDKLNESIARLIRALWDTGFPLGCVVRSISDCKRILGEDLASDTALLDTRYLAGSKSLYRRLISQVIEPFFTRRRQWFVNEMNSALREGVYASDTALFTVEPHLKNGICTLRDCQRIVWGTRVSEKMFTAQEQHYVLNFDHRNKQKFKNAYHFLLQVRCALHIVTGFRLDTLEFSQQQSVATYLGFGEDSAGLLMENIFETVSDVKLLLQIHLENQDVKNPLLQKLRWYVSGVPLGFKIKLLDGILAPYGTIPPSHNDPLTWIMEVYQMAIQYQAFPGTQLQNRIHLICDGFAEISHVTDEVNNKFVQLISLHASLGRILRSMYETGVLELIIPEMKSIRCKVEYDSYHEFTIDQHTLCAFSLIDELEKDSDPQLQNIVKSLTGLFTLRMAVLLHDIGKPLIGSHAYTGALIAANISDRLGIDEFERDRIILLIQLHLDLSLLAFQREPEDHTIAEFAVKVKDVSTLNLLYLLTVVDIRSVGKKTWTCWKGIQLKTVYERVKIHLECKGKPDTAPSQQKNGNYFSEYNHLFELLSNEKSIQVEVEAFTGFERLVICGHDRSHFFADIVGCLSSEGYNILSAQISTTDNGKVLDIFHVEPDTVIRIPSAQRIKNLIGKWNKLASGTITTDKLIKERSKLYPVKQQRVSNIKESEIKIDNAISKDYSVIELKTRDRHGLLYSVAQCLSLCGVNIVSAKLSTRVSKAVDVFYATGQDGLKITNDQKQCEIRSAIIKLLSKD